MYNLVTSGMIIIFSFLIPEVVWPNLFVKSLLTWSNDKNLFNASIGALSLDTHKKHVSISTIDTTNTSTMDFFFMSFRMQPWAPT